jgi:hypothetical protein
MTDLIHTNKKCITSVTPTICRLMKIDTPSCSNGDILLSLMEEAENRGIEPIEKCLVYAPDAMGTHMYRKYQSRFSRLLEYAPLAVPLCTVFPPKTPVCFASLFTGALPSEHGIQEPIRPVLTCETIFDTLVRGGKKAAIAAVTGSSIDLIFRNRPIDYFSEAYDQQVIARTIQLLQADEHDFIVAYQQEFDDAVHKMPPESEPALRAYQNHINSFLQLAKCFHSAWAGYHRMILFTPDHGAHLNPQTGIGSHGENIPEDMEITHFYGIYPAREKTA